MHSSDRRLCALVRQMATNQPSHPTPRFDKLSPHQDLALSADEADCERGTFGQDVQPDCSWSRTYFGPLRLAGYLGLALLVHHFWPATFLHSCYHGWESKAALALDGLCPQFEALTPPGHKALLDSLNDEFGSGEFKLRAYESLGGAVRIP